MRFAQEREVTIWEVMTHHPLGRRQKVEARTFFDDYSRRDKVHVKLTCRLFPDETVFILGEWLLSSPSVAFNF